MANSTPFIDLTNILESVTDETLAKETLKKRFALVSTCPSVFLMLAYKKAWFSLASDIQGKYPFSFLRPYESMKVLRMWKNEGKISSRLAAVPSLLAVDKLSMSEKNYLVRTLWEEKLLPMKTIARVFGKMSLSRFLVAHFLPYETCPLDDETFFRENADFLVPSDIVSLPLDKLEAFFTFSNAETRNYTLRYVFSFPQPEVHFSLDASTMDVLKREHAHLRLSEDLKGRGKGLSPAPKRM